MSAMPTRVEVKRLPRSCLTVNGVNRLSGGGKMGVSALRVRVFSTLSCADFSPSRYDISDFCFFVSFRLI